MASKKGPRQPPSSYVSVIRIFLICGLIAATLWLIAGLVHSDSGVAFRSVIVGLITLACLLTEKLPSSSE